MSTERTRRALVICYSLLASDPRVTRQIDWLTGDGWLVDTLGFGPTPTPETHEHFALVPQPALVRPAVSKALVHVLLPAPARFRLLMESQIPRRLLRDKPAAGYDLILVNDIDLLPWVVRVGPSLLSAEPGATIHLDVHEFHTWAAEPGIPAPISRRLHAFHSWTRSHIASPVFSTRSTVADGIADLYAQEFSIPRPAIVRNSPAYLQVAPSPVDPDRIELVYHGNAEMARGLDILIEAFRLVESRFVLTLMLTGSDAGKAQLRELTRDLGDRVTFVPPVPMNEVSRAINRYDLEIIFYPPTSPNFLHSFPNKFFESVQGRLGVVIGRSPSMLAIVERFGNGVIVDGWDPADLARTLNGLTAVGVTALKAAADACAAELNSDVEGRRFLASFGQELRA